jgi:hypothetical protein
MGFTPKVLIDSQTLTDAIATYYTGVASTIAQTGELVLYNGHTANVGVNIHLVPSGDSAVAANQLYDEATNGLVLVPQETRRINLNQTLSTGDTIEMSASVTAVITARMSGVEFT